MLPLNVLLLEPPVFLPLVLGWACCSHSLAVILVHEILPTALYPAHVGRVLLDHHPHAYSPLLRLELAARPTHISLTALRVPFVLLCHQVEFFSVVFQVLRLLDVARVGQIRQLCFAVFGSSVGGVFQTQGVS